jgi:hypothetical protein
MTTLREARANYYEVNGFGADGGASKWVDWLMLGPIPVPIPNPKARVDAIAAHDASHLLAGYATHWRGEFEESAYEVAAGCRQLWFAWVINLHGLFVGMLLIPRLTWAAWRRGREALSVYDVDMEELLELSVEEARVRLHVPAQPQRPVSMGDVGWLVANLSVAGVMVAAQLGAFGGVIYGLGRALGAW